MSSSGGSSGLVLVVLWPAGGGFVSEGGLSTWQRLPLSGWGECSVTKEEEEMLEGVKEEEELLPR